MYTKVDSTMTIGDLIAGKDYRVVVYCGYDVEKDIPKATENKIGSVIDGLKLRTAKSFQTIKHMTKPSRYYSSQSRLKKSL